jgi:hypothetical protein
MKPTDEFTVATRIITSRKQPGLIRLYVLGKLHHYILCQEELTVYPTFYKFIITKTLRFLS